MLTRLDALEMPWAGFKFMSSASEKWTMLCCVTAQCHMANTLLEWLHRWKNVPKSMRHNRCLVFPALTDLYLIGPDSIITPCAQEKYFSVETNQMKICCHSNLCSDLGIWCFSVLLNTALLSCLQFLLQHMPHMKHSESYHEIHLVDCGVVAQVHHLCVLCMVF